MTDARYRLPSDVAKQLQVSPSTLRRWSNEFSDSLSDSAGRPEPAEGGQTAHRRYTDQDLETLMTIKGLLTEGMTYVQVARRLEALRLRQTVADADSEDDEQPVRALTTSPLDASRYSPAMTVLSDTLHTVAEGQQLILGSQQANRDLLTVMLQDNFGLKEENAKLRDRMLEMERELAEMRRLDESRREATNARLRQLEAMVQKASSAAQRSQPSQPSQSSSSSQRSGCLGQLFGS